MRMEYIKKRPLFGGQGWLFWLCYTFDIFYNYPKDLNLPDLH